MESSTKLREELESQKFLFETKYQEQTLEKVDEHSHLQDTIMKLRKELDKKHG
jgi:hypothetical protein